MLVTALGDQALDGVVREAQAVEEQGHTVTLLAARPLVYVRTPQFASERPGARTPTAAVLIEQQRDVVVRVHDEVDLLTQVADRLIRKLLPARGAHLAVLAALKVVQELHNYAVVIIPAAHVVRLAHGLVLVAHQVLVYLDIEVYQYLVGNENQSVSQANYVRRWDDHDRVVMELLDYLERCEHGEVCAASGEKLSNESVCYLREKVHLIVDTHYNIALLFDEDRSRGRARARAFRRELRRADIDQWARGEQRYRMALLLNRLSFSYNSIKRLVSKRRH